MLYIYICHSDCYDQFVVVKKCCCKICNLMLTYTVPLSLSLSIYICIHTYGIYTIPIHDYIACITSNCHGILTSNGQSPRLSAQQRPAGCSERPGTVAGRGEAQDQSLGLILHLLAITCHNHTYGIIWVHETKQLMLPLMASK